MKIPSFCVAFAGNVDGPYERCFDASNDFYAEGRSKAYLRRKRR